MEKITYIKYSGAILAATERNDHGKAIELGLKCLNLDEETLNNKLNHLARIQKEHERLGYLHPNLAGERYSIYEFVIETAKEKMNEKCYEAFYQSF